ncbi:hypothetical protein JJL45_05290 [Tamlana sp. s12]|uniref:hypothetical protein n=1 Tax=Tamlana sp. s12 TaxID=1630406 RepID=UPI0007FB8EF9|nr:hypothetical protein [Tamlana sp. s12]OBQ56081.1 hypothetical protein VQ01_06770 [Tamlana sp. s12]QQY83406.1 hypothetical protein JJL45_05290 [Tamlana sp. s12]
MFRNKTTLDKLNMANGRVLMEKTEHTHIYKVLKVSKNVNYESLGKKIEVGDLVICAEYMYNNSFKLDGKNYFIVKPTAICGYFG